MNIIKIILLSLLVCWSIGDADTELPNVVIPSRYTNMQAFDDTLTMYWKLNTSTQEIEIGLECACTGWVGVGFAKSTGMLNSDVIIGWVSDGVPSVSDYGIGGTRAYQCPDGVCLDTQMGHTDDVLAFNGSETSTTTYIIFTRKLSTGDSIDVDITSKGMTTIYGWQTNSQDGPFLIKHVGTPNPVIINYFTGATKAVANLKLIHGSLMFIAWFGLAPFGFILARFLKQFPWWFNAHRIIMSVAMATSIAAFGVIVYEVPHGEHFNNGHKIIGLIVFIIGVAQPVIGFLADKFFDPNRKAVPIFPDMIHWILGWFSIILGMINIILGLILYPYTKRAVLVVYCIGAALVFTGCVGFAIFRLMKPGKSH